LSATPNRNDDETLALPPGEARPTADLIGRYRVEKILGQGGIGTVYLAYDEQLKRHVAVKVPRRELVISAERAEQYLREARTLAALDHPSIVHVYDVGSTAEQPFFIVSQYVEGTNLAARLCKGRLSTNDAVRLVVEIADALHYAHERRLVHRDIKPSNILLDRDGRSYLADFGLAMEDSERGKGPGLVGTVPYMSPEQARGEADRLDGRSDVFSLGVILYELLTGRRPFVGATASEILDQIATLEPRPPRQINAGIPDKLERICLRALSKKPNDRYTTARDIAEDLRSYLYLDQSGKSSVRYRAVSEALKRSLTAKVALGRAGCSFGIVVAFAILLWLWPQARAPVVVSDDFPRPGEPPVLQGSVDNELDILANDPQTKNGQPQIVPTSFPAVIRGGSTLRLNPAGNRLLYTPAPTTVGRETFPYRVTDGRHVSAPGSVTVHITPRIQDEGSDKP
jgi:serine/threonine protein kinase